MNFTNDQLADGHNIRTLNVISDFDCEALGIEFAFYCVPSK
jgi:hypothetical protein